ncbi:MAG: amidohydrolase family protein [Spirochaetales bacterium]|nr:amidohydrolase family protein [Spirochaetales bacterium]
MIIKNGKVLHANRMEIGCDVRTEGKTIRSIGPELKGEYGEEVIDAEGCYVLPGLIDIHTHGLHEVRVDHGDLAEFARLQLGHGITACVPTLAGTLQEDIEVIRKGLKETDHFKRTPNLVGFRPEILYISDASAGSSDSLAPITAENTEALFEAGQGTIRIWDVSPELEGATDFIRWAARNGIVTSMAHSFADVPQIREAVDAGMRLVTHFYDLFPIPEEIDEGVYPEGVTDYINIEDRLTVEIIPDGVHVYPMLVEKSLRCKGMERVVFITDSVPGAGSSPGIYDGLYPGWKLEVTPDRGVRRVSDDLLSGSALTLEKGFFRAVNVYGRSLPQASMLCSGNAARLLGIDRKGYLASGMDADIIIVNPDLELQKVIVAGKPSDPRRP